MDILYVPSTGYIFGNLMTILKLNIMGRSTDYRRLLILTVSVHTSHENSVICLISDAIKNSKKTLHAVSIAGSWITTTSLKKNTVAVLVGLLTGFNSFITL